MQHKLYLNVLSYFFSQVTNRVLQLAITNCTTKTYQNNRHVIIIRWERGEISKVCFFWCTFNLFLTSTLTNIIIYSLFFTLPSRLSKCISTSCPKFTSLSYAKYSIVDYAVYVTKPINSAIPNPVHYAASSNVNLLPSESSRTSISSVPLNLPTMLRTNSNQITWFGTTL